MHCGDTHQSGTENLIAGGAALTLSGEVRTALRCKSEPSVAFRTWRASGRSPTTARRHGGGRRRR